MRRLLLSLILMIAAAAPALAEPRVALVIGNSRYSGDLPKLANPSNDAELMAETLKHLGFQVVKVQDADLNQMKRALHDFGALLTSAGPTAVGLFYYAGHGLQINGENYLIPLKANIQQAADVDLEAIDASLVLKQMQFAGNALNVIILDACRNNPLSRGMRSAGGGLARMDAPMGTFVAYSTAPGETAADGTGRDSPYTIALTKAMMKPGIAIEEAFRDARVDVLAATDRQQIPWESSSLTGAFIFNPGPKGADTQVASVAVPAAPSTPVAPALPAAPAEPRSPQPTAVAPGKTFKDCANCPEMVSLPAGQFRMGSPDSENGRSPAEGPQLDVAISAFAIGKYPVTRGEFASFVRSAGYKPAGKCWTDIGGKFDFSRDADWNNPGFSQTDKDPVVCVNWNDATAYAKWVAKTTGKPYRLVGDAEYEYAARAGTTTSRYWGDSDSNLCAYGNIADRAAKQKYPGWNIVDCDDGHAYTAPVGSFKPNGFGLYDMTGNVKQWVADCWGHDLTRIQTNGGINGGDCDLKSVRGAAWDGLPSIARSAFREGNHGDYASFNYGFRVARGE